MNVLISPDKFKGTLTASQAAHAIAQGWKASRPADSVTLLPMSDGGDGFGEILGHLIGATERNVSVVDAAHRPLTTSWWWHEPSKTALVESARVIGLAQLPPKAFHPFDLDTFGLGQVLMDAVEHGASRCIVGIGGSATNDAGFGMARALGWRFLAENREPIERWTELTHLRSIERPGRNVTFEELVVACDVKNPLLGATGCSRIYGPQKGLRPEDFGPAEAALARFATALATTLGRDVSEAPGAGAAGGLGFALLAFLDGRLVPGFEIFSRQADLPARLRTADLVLTGEGSIDRSTAMGKGVGQLALACRECHVPCIGLSGVHSHPEETRRLFQAVHALTPELTSLENALSQPAKWLETLTAQLAAEWDSEKPRLS